MSSAPICVVGGGIVGLTTAYFLAKENQEVLLIERDSFGSHASGFAYGSLSPLGEAGHYKDISSEIELAKFGMSLHTEFANHLTEFSGIDIQHRFRPAIDLAFSDEEAIECKVQSEWRKTQKGYSSEWLNSDEVRKLVPEISSEIIGAAYTEGVADVDPYRLVLALVQACEKMGVTIQHGEVTGINVTNDTITSINTTTKTIECSSIVLAMGPWMKNISNWINIDVPIRPLKGQIIKLNVPKTTINYSVGWKGNYACTKLDDLLWVGTTEEDIGFDNNPTTSERDTLISIMLKMFPGLDNAELVQHTACLRPLAQDGIAIIDKIEQYTNLILASGAGRKGILLGPAMGKIVSELLTNQKTSINIDKFSISRFQN